MTLSRYCAIAKSEQHILTPFQNKSLSNARGQPHVGIVGAGFSGLRCADILLQHGFRVTIIEGRDRIGGRVYQKALPNGRLADMGPNWIHGTNDNPMMDLAKETGTSLERSDAQTYVFDPSGKMLPVKEGERYATIMWDIIQDAFQYSNKNGRSISENTSLLDFFKDKVVEKIPDSEENHEIARKTILQLAEMWGAFIGSPISQQSLKFFWLEECIEGGKSMNM
jgi:phytoene dehydrogenase-like protein